MPLPHDDRIRLLVDELDRLIPRDGACVRLEQYGGGPSESRVVANQLGYLRLGVELLKGGLHPGSPEPAPLPVDLGDLMASDSAIRFDEFLFDDKLTADDRHRPRLAQAVGMALGLGLAAGCLTVLVLAAVGVIALLGWR